ncbi:MAG: hypothetical protein J0I09_03655 [Sphingobacteriia bacterium]|nr:hypothetical protein [Sphingobacteriia bacterium]
MDNVTIKAGTTGGTLLAIAANLKSDDVIKTIVLGSIGAIVSFFVSLALKLLMKKLREGRSK